MIFSKSFKNLNFKKFQNVEDLNHVVGYCEGTLRGTVSALSGIANLEFECHCLISFRL